MNNQELTPLQSQPRCNCRLSGCKSAWRKKKERSRVQFVILILLGPFCPGKRSLCIARRP
ncbi:hypothetical protein WN48_03817 [Eufriesea mexicana]|uniref:Uncharacterized protein n=1 Tax=Eufriesea mexicana TaxID=516756 RepID=A0A310SMF4_9HYME|nr:hypothetical protein WN48_03817 [Eufriesea mexicana]